MTRYETKNPHLSMGFFYAPEEARLRFTTAGRDFPICFAIGINFSSHYDLK
jgi:hypothetical protein